MVYVLPYYLLLLFSMRVPRYHLTFKNEIAGNKYRINRCKTEHFITVLNYQPLLFNKTAYYHRNALCICHRTARVSHYIFYKITAALALMQNTLKSERLYNLKID